jgi:hypothetical protein
LKELEVVRTFEGEMLKESWQSKNQMMDKARLSFFSKPLLGLLKANSNCLASYAWDAFGNRMLYVFIY